MLAVPVALVLPKGTPPADDPWAHVPPHLPKTDHSDLLPGPFADGPAVTRACLECHEEAASEVMATAHWTWEGDPVPVPGHEGLHRIGKKTAINNFCISVQSNWAACTACHAGYGWKDASFDFTAQEDVDCLVCHDQSGQYVKSKAGLPAETVDLAASAQSVGGPTRDTCGSCHFKGGGGAGVKHGDLDTSLMNPTERVDVHMGRHEMLCTDCHVTEKHSVRGRSISVSVDQANRASCTDCHSTEPHGDSRIDLHTRSVACQTCHIPEVAIREATKIHWDWSTAGKDQPEDPHHYLKKKGSFEYAELLRPEYAWFDGTADRYLLGDPTATNGSTVLNRPHGDRLDPNSLIWPFKVHRGKQIRDAENGYLLVPKTAGAGGYWEDYDWDQAVRLGCEATGLEYSGQYDFAETEMYWALTHMVAPADHALQCGDCHEGGDVLDWEALGYHGDPLEWGGRPLPPVTDLAEGTR
ncbi:MAG: tetrathionate reductase family octaheme c-type cytochrome [Gemmatimonadetes bacterium]|nr:tetrathionate reductase family octaheme c-type cytochrome [Gemmatimonadota bacterium]